MQAELQSSFQRVEQALQRLTDSIAAYNPSTKAAEELQEADEAVNKDLERLVIHQRNHARKEVLRAQAAAHDEEIRSRIRQLADTRKELLNIAPYHPADTTVREVEVQELLRYAKFIAKTTVPPTALAKAAREEEDARVKTQEDARAGTPAAPPAVVKREESAGVAQQLANGTATPPPDTQQQNAPQQQHPAHKAIPNQDKLWLNHPGAFEPWPHHSTVQSGALGAIQRMVEAGTDPAGVLSKEERAEKEERERMEEEKRGRVEREERERKRVDGLGGGGGRRRRKTEEEVFNPDEM